MIPLRGAQPQRTPARGDGGLLSTLSSYLMTPYGASSDALVPDATESDIENTLCTIDCITSCRLDELYSEIMYVPLCIDLSYRRLQFPGSLNWTLWSQLSEPSKRLHTNGPWQSSNKNRRILCIPHKINLAQCLTTLLPCSCWKLWSAYPAKLRNISKIYGICSLVLAHDTLPTFFDQADCL